MGRPYRRASKDDARVLPVTRALSRKERPVHRLTHRFTRIAATAGAIALILAAAQTAYADHGGGSGGGGGGGGGGDGGSSTLAPVKVTVVNEVADQSGNAAITDANLLNPWGMAIGPSGGALWVANNNTNTATLYTGGLNGAAVAKASLTVTVPGGKPTGQAFSGGKDFVVTGSTGSSGPARFLFATDQGDISAWNPTADSTHAIAEDHVSGAIFRGLTMLADPSGDFLLAADFHNNKIDIFDSTFKAVTPASGQFVDKNLPSGFAPFNVQAVGTSVYVAYAAQDSHASMPQTNGGIIDVFTNDGKTVSRISTNNVRAPWGLAIAPSTFGSLSGDLLVGSFHDGSISVFSGSTFVGELANQNGQAIQISNLWALTPGNPQNGGAGVIFFSAGPSDGGHGLVGELVPPSS
jgi:uncharacterized protein (TIGR03118 family)